MLKIDFNNLDYKLLLLVLLIAIVFLANLPKNSLTGGISFIDSIRGRFSEEVEPPSNSDVVFIIDGLMRSIRLGQPVSIRGNTFIIGKIDEEEHRILLSLNYGKLIDIVEGEPIVVSGIVIKAHEVNPHRIVITTKRLLSQPYTCRGFTENSLCYYDPDPGPIRPNYNVYEDNKIKIYSDYPERTLQDRPFEFSLVIENKLNKQVRIKYRYDYSSPGDGYEKISIQNFNNAVLTESRKGVNFYEITLNPRERRFLNGNFISKRPNIFSNLITHSYYFFQLDINEIDNAEVYNLSFNFKSITPFEIRGNPYEYTFCGSEIFPNFYEYNICPGGEGCSTGAYQFSKCCNNVFYPGFECCNDNDCFVGICVDGICRNAILEGSTLDTAVGTKRTLFIAFDPYLSSDIGLPCMLNNYVITSRDDVATITQGIESYFDEMARIHLNEDSNFINFDFDYLGPFALNQLGFGVSPPGSELLDSIQSICNLNNLREEYDEIIIIGVTVSQEHGVGPDPVPAAGLAGKPIIAPYSLNTIVHELTHNFGCRHINDFDLGTVLQWGSDIMGGSPGRDSRTLEHTLQVCRGEMGWVDANGNNILDVLEVQS